MCWCFSIFKLIAKNTLRIECNSFKRVIWVCVCVRNIHLFFLLLLLLFESPGFYMTLLIYLFIYLFALFSFCFVVVICFHSVRLMWECAVVERCYFERVCGFVVSWSNYNIYNAMRIDFFFCLKKNFFFYFKYTQAIYNKELNQKSTWKFTSSQHFLS